MSNVSSPTPVTGNPLEAWGDMTTYWYIDSQKTTQGPFNLAQMISWAEAGQLPPKTHVLPSTRRDEGYPSNGFVYLDSLPEIWQPSGERGSASRPRRHDGGERGRSPRRSPRRSRSGSRGRDDSPRPSKLDEITVKAAPQPPATAVQQALWAAAAKAQPGAVSPAEAAHRQREPPKPSADGALHRAATTLWLTWHYELLQIRAANPAPPAFPYLNREILHASALPVGTPLPRGLRSWTATLLVRYFNRDDSSSALLFDFPPAATLREMTIASVYVTYQFRGGIRE